MWKEILLKAVGGHAGSAAGGALILDGLKDMTPEQILTGLVMVAVTTGLSALRKWSRAKKAKLLASLQK